MTFGEIHKTSGAMFLVSQLDGILGLAYQTISVNKFLVFADLMRLVADAGTPDIPVPVEVAEVRDFKLFRINLSLN